MSTTRITSSMAAARFAATALVLSAGALSAAFGQATQEGPIVAGTPTASDGGKAVLIPPRPIAPEADPVNVKVAADTVDGLVVTVTIDGPAVTLDSAVPARVPRRLARADRQAGEQFVKATAFSGGTAVSTTVLPDVVLNASEGSGLVRLTRRQIALVLSADRAIDTVTIEAPATGASATLDVRAAYARFCEADRNNKWCPRR